MKIIYCWRCKTNVPMLDEIEFEIVSNVYDKCVKNIKDLRELTGTELKNIDTEKVLKPVCDEYEKISKYKETNANAIMHHRLTLIGKICPKCSRPFRTPKASFCAECGFNE